MGKKQADKTKKTRKTFGGLFKLLDMQQGKTVPVEQLLALGLPKECRGGRIVCDQKLKGGEGGRRLEYEVAGERFAVGYDPGPKPFGKSAVVDITVLGTYN